MEHNLANKIAIKMAINLTNKMEYYLSTLLSSQIKKEYNYLSFTFTTNQNGPQPRNTTSQSNSQSKWQHNLSIKMANNIAILISSN